LATAAEAREVTSEDATAVAMAVAVTAAATVARSAAATAAAIWEQNARGTPGVKKNGWVTGPCETESGFEPR